MSDHKKTCLLSEFLAPDAAVHFIGCGGVGTAPLMRIFHQKGFHVSGSDLKANKETEALQNLGLPVFIGEHNAQHLPDAKKLLLVHTSAADDANPEIKEAKNRNAVILRRGKALAELTQLYDKVISVSGSHGKTSVTAMLAYVMLKLGTNPGYLIGGAVPGMIAGDAGNGNYFITEADESDGSHTWLDSHIGIVTNVEDDHVWSLGGWDVLQENFRIFARRSDTLLYYANTCTDELFRTHKKNIRITQQEFTPETIFSEQINRTKGAFQLQNLYTVLRTLEHLGFSRENILTALEHFPGVDRRMSVRLDTPELRIVEDYAHHPTEVRESLKAMRKINPDKRMIVVFQPHRYARLERYFDEFVKELSAADLLFIQPVFAAWTGNGKYTSDDLAAAAKGIALHGTMEEMAKKVQNHLKHGDLLCVLGAGDGKDLISYFLEKTFDN